MFFDPSSPLASADMAIPVKSPAAQSSTAQSSARNMNAEDTVNIERLKVEKLNVEELAVEAPLTDPKAQAGERGHLCPVVKSYLSPWLAPLVYGFGDKVLLPAYFSQITVTGQENIPTDGPVVLAPTHQSRWDPLLVGLLCKRAKRYPRFMVTADECLGIQGWFIRRLGGFPVHVRKPSVRSLRHGVELLTGKEMLVIYPEGNIYRDRIHPLKPGLSRIALRAERSTRDLNVKIIPISMEYSDQCPKWRGSAKILVGQPMSVSDYLTGDRKAQSKQLTADLQSTLVSLAAQNTRA